MRFIFSFLLFALLWGLPLSWATAQPGNTAAGATYQPLELRQPNAQKLRALQENKDFQYYQDVRPDISAWERFWQKVGRWINRLFSGRGGASSPFWKYFSYVFLVGITVFVILKLMQVDFVGLFGRKRSKVAVPYEAYTENIHELDFQALIDEAEAQGDYRRATRLYYLSLLKVLSDLELIKWTPGKTNRTYVTELNTSPLQRPFEHITQLFEYVWYGGSTLDQVRFSAVRQSFIEFNQSLKAKA